MIQIKVYQTEQFMWTTMGLSRKMYQSAYRKPQYLVILPDLNTWDSWILVSFALIPWKKWFSLIIFMPVLEIYPYLLATVLKPKQKELSRNCETHLSPSHRWLPPNIAAQPIQLTAQCVPPRSRQLRLHAAHTATTPAATPTTTTAIL